MNISILYNLYSVCWEWSFAYLICQSPIPFFIHWEVVPSPTLVRCGLPPRIPFSARLVCLIVFLMHALLFHPIFLLDRLNSFLSSFLIYKALSISFFYSFFDYVNILPRLSFRGHWVCNLVLSSCF